MYVDGKSYFLDAVDCGSKSKTAEFHQKRMESAISTATEKYDCQVTSVVTDNARVMQKSRLLLAEQHENINVYSFNAHCLNLLGQDITDQALVSKVVKINKFFRRRQLPSEWLKECEGSLRLNCLGTLAGIVS